MKNGYINSKLYNVSLKFEKIVGNNSQKEKAMTSILCTVTYVSDGRKKLLGNRYHSFPTHTVTFSFSLKGGGWSSASW